ncbi:hypothetical protein SDJN02_08524, partial [Cucurbita argyrosperma subsp. argyrosperma]
MSIAEQLWLCLPQLVNPNNKDIQDIPGLAPPVQTQSRRLKMLPIFSSSIITSLEAWPRMGNDDRVMGANG